MADEENENSDYKSNKRQERGDHTLAPKQTHDLETDRYAKHGVDDDIRYLFRGTIRRDVRDIPSIQQMDFNDSKKGPDKSSNNLKEVTQ